METRDDTKQNSVGKGDTRVVGTYLYEAGCRGCRVEYEDSRPSDMVVREKTKPIVASVIVTIRSYFE